MSLRKLDIPLDNTFSKQYKLDTYGFYINKIPPNMEAYLILDTDPNQQIDLSAQTKIPRNKMIKSFILANRKSLPGKTLSLYYTETISDFNDLPEAPNAGVEGNLIDTNQLLEELNNKTNIVNTDNIKLTVDNIGLAKEATLSSMIQYIDNIESKLDNLNSKDFATQTTLSSINLNVDEIETKLDNLNSKDFATQTTLNDVKTNLDTLNSKDFATQTTLNDVKLNLDTLNSKDFATQTTLLNIYNHLLNNYIKTFTHYAVDNEQMWYFMNTYTTDKVLTLTNPSGSGKNVKISLLEIDNNDTNALTWNIVLNASPDTNVSTLTVFNKAHGSINTHDFTLQQSDNLTGGTSAGTKKLESTTMTRSGSKSTSIIKLLEGESVSYQFTGSVEYNILINIVEM
jgi:hypothetical protein